ncbi:MAG TPA: DUF4432 family protein [Trichocoleus sp.]
MVTIDPLVDKSHSTTALILENTEIKLIVRPDLGGRIDQLQDKRTGHEWLWHPDHYDAQQTRSLPIGTSFDENWTGGWDEIFPNDAAGEFRGHNLVDHGELWSQSWSIIKSDSLQVTLQYNCQTVPVTVEKTISVDAIEPKVTIDYKLQNHSDEEISFLLKQHAAIAIEPGDEILLPDCCIEPVTLDFSKIIGRSEETRFPKAFAADGTEIEIQQIPPQTSQLQEFYYSSELAIGQCGIRNQTSQSALIMNFDTQDFPYVWVFQSYGGWRNYYVLVMEPCTTMPYDLEVACQNGTVAQLQPQEIQQRSLTVTLQRS